MSSSSPPNPSSRYSDAELRGFRTEFARQVIPYRQYCRRAIIVVGSGFVATFIGSVFIPFGPGLWPLVGVGLVVAGLLVYDQFRRPKLTCPACQRRINLNSVGLYCPKCGSGQGITKPWFGPAKCDDCGKVIDKGEDSRSWKVHACTYCGVYLDDDGL